MVIYENHKTLTLISASFAKQLSRALLLSQQLTLSRTIVMSTKYRASTPWHCILLGLLPFMDVIVKNCLDNVVIMTEGN